MTARPSHRHTARRAAVRLGLALAGLLPASAALAQAGSSEAEPFLRSYALVALTPLQAEVLAWEQCPPEAGNRCRVTQSGISENRPYIGVVADAATHARIARVLAQRESAPTTRRFHLLLLIANFDGKGLPEGLPQGAAKALGDLRGFLPYTGYGLVDVAWLQTADNAEATLNGPDGLPLEVGLSFENRVGDDLYVDAFHLRRPPILPEPGKAGATTPGRQLLATSFSLKVGETVVVGTSKLDGGKEALVTLVTAVP